MVHERRPHHFRATDRIPAAQRISKVCRPLLWRREPSRIYLLGPISGHDLRPVDLSRKSARHRGQPRRHTGKALPYGLSRSRAQIHSGRRQRHARLAHLRRLCASVDRTSTAALRHRTDGHRTRSKPLRAGLIDHRLMPELVSVGAFSPPQSRRQNAHSA